MLGRTNARGGGEVRGCTIVAITNRDDCVGLPATLSFGGEVIQTKFIASDLSIVFDAVQTDGEYTIDTENAEGDAVHASVAVTARNILDTDTLTVALDMNVQLINYTMLLDTTSGALDECIDLTGGWGIDGYVATEGGTVSSTNLSSGTKQEDYLHVSTAPVSSVSCGFGTLLPIKSENYNKVWSIVTVNNVAAFAARNAKEFQWSDSDSYVWSVTNSLVYRDLVKDSDIYITFCIFGKNTIARDLYIYNVFLTKADDWQTLMQKGNVSVASLDEFFADVSKISTLLANKSAVYFMLAKCTGDFMAQAVASQNFLNALNNSPYKSLVFVNQHWSKFLFMVGVTA